MKGQAKPRGRGGTLNQINQTSWDTPFALSVTSELTDGKKKGKEEFARSLPGPDSCSPTRGGERARGSTATINQMVAGWGEGWKAILRAGRWKKGAQGTACCAGNCSEAGG